MSNWKQINNNTPENIELETVIIENGEERNKQRLTKKGNLWWSGNMYVYYTPTHYKL